MIAVDVTLRCLICCSPVAIPSAVLPAGKGMKCRPCSPSHLIQHSIGQSDIVLHILATRRRVM
jgi:hypothetical protein